MKTRARIASGLAALAALFLAPLAEASLSRVTAAERAIEAPAITLSAPSEFSLFEGHELAAAAAESERAESFHPLAAVSLLDERVERELVTPLEANYPKTRYRVFELLGTPLIGVFRGVSLELHWGCGEFRSGISEDIFQGAWTDPITGLQYKRARWYDARNASFLTSDPMGDQDSPNLYGFVGARPHEKTDPLGLQAAGDDPIDPDYADAARPYLEARARESQATRTVGRVAGGIATGLDIATDFAPGIGLAKIPLPFIEAYHRGGRAELRRLGVSVGAVAIIAAVITHRTRLPGVKATEGELALEAKAEAALRFEQRQLAQQAAAAEAKASAAVASGGIPVGSTRHITLQPVKKGSYTVSFESEIGYAGKGPPSRARRSARQHSRQHSDPVVSIDHTVAETEEEALRQEAARLEALGGPESPRNYNKINSPGKKLRLDEPP